MLIINLLISLIIPLLIGYYILMLIFTDKEYLPFSFKLALSFPTGLGIITLWMLGIGMLNLSYKYSTVVVPSLLLMTSLGIMAQKKNAINTTLLNYPFHKPTTKKEPLSNRLISSLLKIFIIFHVIYILWESLSYPVHTWDVVATIAFKAKIFFFEKHLPDLNTLPHKTYPLFVPLTQTWIAINLGQWNDFLIKIMSPFIFITYLITQYHFLKFYTTKIWALSGCALLISSNLLFNHATDAYRDIYLMHFNCSTIMLLLLWHQTQKPGFLYLSSFFAGMTSFTKLEGSAFLPIYILIIIILAHTNRLYKTKERWAYIFKFSVPALMIAGIFHIFKIMNGAIKDGEGAADKTGFDFTLQKIYLLPQILSSFLEELFLSNHWGFIWYLFGLSLIFIFRIKKGFDVKIILLCVALFFILYISVALLTVNYIFIAGELRHQAIDRLVLHFFPLSILVVILSNYLMVSSRK